MNAIFSMIVKLLGLTNRLGKMRDLMLIGMMGGFIGTVAMDLMSLLFYLTRKSENTLAHIGGSMIVGKSRIGQRKNTLLGQIWHMITGIGLGVPIMYCFNKTGINNHRIKGAFLGAVTWGLVYGLGAKLKLYAARPRLTKSHYSYLLTDILYGIFTAEAIKQFSDPEVFQDNITNDLPFYEGKTNRYESGANESYIH